MRRTILVAIVLLGCKGKKAGEPAGEPTGGTAVASAAIDAAAAPVCDLAGEYRVRFRSNGADGWWLRFKVAAGPPVTAELTASDVMLTLQPPGPLTVVADTAKCSLVVTTVSENAGDIKMTMAVDPASGAVTGELTRSKSYDPKESAVPLTGYHGPNTPPKGSECIVPGVYEVFYETGRPWKNADEGDDRKCVDVVEEHVTSTYLRVEWLGNQLAVDQVENEGGDKPVFKDDFGDETVTVAGCEATIGYSSERLTVEGARLTFGAGKAAGKAASTKVQVIVPVSDEGEDIWDCVSKDLPLSATLLKP